MVVTSSSASATNFDSLNRISVEEETPSKKGKLKTMKTMIVTLLTAGALALAFNAQAQSPGSRIVVVDLNRLFNEYYKTPIASSKLKETGESYQKEADDMMTQYRKQTEDLNKLREDAEKPEFTKEVQEQKRKALQEKLGDISKAQREIEEYARTHKLDMDRQMARMRQTILKEITDVVTKEAKDSGYTLVLDKSGQTLNGVPSVVYSQELLDITDGVLKILNKNAPKVEAIKPPPAKDSEKKPEPKK